MTHTDPTARDLLRGVLLHPDDDHARLVYADWLEENAGTAPCPDCKGACRLYRTEVHGEFVQTALGGPVHKLGYGKVVECPTCHGTGTVSDGFAERAEFIRVQVELETLLASSPPLTGVPDWTAEVARAKTRSWKLQHEHAREWFGIKCPVCKGGEATPFGSAPGDCAHCTGTGSAPFTVRRGFAESVTCRMGDVLRHGWEQCPDCVALSRRRGAGGAAQPRCGKCEGGVRRAWHLTPWAADVLAAHPVTRWEIVDREPDRTNPLEAAPVPAAVRSWFRDDGLGVLRGEVPKPVFDALPGDGRHYVGDGEKCFRDDDEARDTLACAVGRVARRLAGLPVS